MRNGPALLLIVSLPILLGGCTIPLGQLPDPNDPVNGGAKTGDLLRKKMKQASDLVNDRQAAGEITPAQGVEILAVQAGDELDRIKGKSVPSDTAWEFAEVAITARRWKDAESYLMTAQKYDLEKIKKDPNDQDRYINDTLRLARTQAAQGNLDQAMKTTRGTFNAPPHWKWPILYAVYLEIVPAAEQATPGHEAELAGLVEEAIKQHEAAQGDVQNQREAGWVAARNFHIHAAWLMAAKLYDLAKKPDLAAQARKNADAVPRAKSV